MKYIKLILFAALIQFTFTGCSYVSDMVEGAITKRASFSVVAYQSGSEVVITWDETDLSTDFAGIEIYRTRESNDEYSGYVTVADRFNPPISGDLSNGSTTTCRVDVPASDGGPTTGGTTGVFFYRVGIIHWDEAEVDRTSANGYIEPWNGASIQTNYDSHTDIDEISGSARVEIN